MSAAGDGADLLTGKSSLSGTGTSSLVGTGTSSLVGTGTSSIVGMIATLMAGNRMSSLVVAIASSLAFTQDRINRTTTRN